jgi:hypothetical protein
MSTAGEVPVTAEQSHADSAQARIEEIRAMRQKIPNLVIPTTKGAGRRLVPTASVPKRFVELTAVAVRNNATLVRSTGQDLAQDRDLTSYAEAYAPLADELEALAHFVRHSVAAAKSKVGSSALTTYAVARVLAKRPETADLLPHVDDMGKALGKRGRNSKPKPAPTPVPPMPVPTMPVPVVATTEPWPVTPPSSTTAAKKK